MISDVLSFTCETPPSHGASEAPFVRGVASGSPRLARQKLARFAMPIGADSSALGLEMHEFGRQ